jgi:hypothetical protein
LLNLPVLIPSGSFILYLSFSGVSLISFSGSFDNIGAGVFDVVFDDKDPDVLDGVGFDVDPDLSAITRLCVDVANFDVG